jgi:hypothetical protein
VPRDRVGVVQRIGSDPGKPRARHCRRTIS